MDSQVIHYLDYTICNGHFVELFVIYCDKRGIIPHGRAYVFCWAFG